MSAMPRVHMRLHVYLQPLARMYTNERRYKPAARVG